MNSFSFCLSGKLLIYPSFMNDNLAMQRILGWKFFPFSTLNMPCHFWPIKFLLKNLLIVLWVSFICKKCFCSVFLAAFKIFSLCLTFNILIILCLGVGFFEFMFFGTLFASRVWMSVLFHKLGKFSATISSNKFSGPFTLLFLGPL